jgi:hypothetical protein
MVEEGLVHMAGPVAEPQISAPIRLIYGVAWLWPVAVVEVPDITTLVVSAWMEER